MFSASTADIAIMGGAAGGGKSFGLLLEPLHYVTKVKGFHAVFFRRTMPEHKKPGGLLHEARDLYRVLGGRFNYRLECWFPEGGSVSLAHLEHESNKYDWGGSQIPLICFDELTLFTRSQFFFMLSRNRSTCGVRPYVRATCNPDADSWVAEFIAWWIDQETGYAIPKRAGKLRWFIREGDELIWGATRQELIDKYGAEQMPTSVTFIPSKLDDNPALMKRDPAYRGRLMSLSKVDRERLLKGNWKIRPTAGLLFQRSWVKLIEIAPAGLELVRYWDLAGTEKRSDNDPDWTIGVLLGRTPHAPHRYVVLHVAREQGSPRRIRDLIKATAMHDLAKYGPGVRIGIPQDPGQAGKSQAQDIVAELAGFDVRSSIESGDKVTRFGPFSAQAEAGNVDVLLDKTWNDPYLTFLENFPEGKKDDADASSGALAMFTAEPAGLVVLREMYQESVAREKVKAMAAAGAH